MQELCWWQSNIWCPLVENGSSGYENETPLNEGPQIVGIEVILEKFGGVPRDAQKAEIPPHMVLGPKILVTWPMSPYPL